MRRVGSHVLPRIAALALMLVTGVATADPGAPPADPVDDEGTRYGAVAPAGVAPAHWQLTRAWIVALADHDVDALARMAPGGLRVRVTELDGRVLSRSCRALSGQRLAGRAGMRRLAACFADRAQDDLRALAATPPAPVVRWTAWATDCSVGDQFDVRVGARGGRPVVAAVAIQVTSCEEP